MYVHSLTPHRAATFSSDLDRLIAPNRIEKNITLDKIRQHVVSTSLVPLLFQATIENTRAWCSDLAEALRRVFAANEHKGQLCKLRFDPSRSLTLNLLLL
jgi:hypothetical protein